MEAQGAGPPGGGAKPSGSGSEAIAAAERIAKNDRGLRRWLILIGAPVTLVIALPWPIPAWTLAERIESTAPLALPAIGLLAVLAGAIGRIPARARGLVAGVLAFALASQLIDLLRVRFVFGAIEDMLQHVDLAPFVVGLASILGAALAELFLHLRRASRPRAFFALLAWLHLLVRAFVPLERDAASIPFLAMTEVLADVRTGDEALLAALGLLGVGLVTLLGIATGVWRALSPMPFRPHVRFRSPWLAFALVAPPAIVTFPLFAYGAFEEEAVLLAVGYIVAAYLWVLFLGIPVFGAHFFSACADGIGGVVRDLRADDAAKKRSATRIAAVLLAILFLFGAWRVVKVFLPDGRDAIASDFLEQVSADVVASAMGRELGPRFLGGYSEFDLRGSRGALAEIVGANAEVEVRLVAVEVLVSPPDGGTATVAMLRTAEGDVAWVDAWVSDIRDVSIDAPGDLGDIFARVHDAAGSATCLPTPSPDAFAGLPPDVTSRLSNVSRVEQFCADEIEQPSWIESWIDPHQRSGALGAVLVIVRADGRHHVFESRFHGQGEGIWIERATLTSH